MNRHANLDHPHTPRARARELRFTVDTGALWKGLLDPAPIVRRAVAAATINRNAPVDVSEVGASGEAWA